MSNLMGMLTTIQSYVWGPPTLLLLIGTGLYFTIKLRGLQITKFPRAVRAISLLLRLCYCFPSIFYYNIFMVNPLTSSKELSILLLKLLECR